MRHLAVKRIGNDLRQDGMHLYRAGSGTACDWTAHECFRRVDHPEHCQIGRNLAGVDYQIKGMDCVHGTP